MLRQTKPKTTQMNMVTPEVFSKVLENVASEIQDEAKLHAKRVQQE